MTAAVDYDSSTCKLAGRHPKYVLVLLQGRAVGQEAQAQVMTASTCCLSEALHACRPPCCIAGTPQPPSAHSTYVRTAVFRSIRPSFRPIEASHLPNRSERGLQLGQMHHAVMLQRLESCPHAKGHTAAPLGARDDPLRVQRLIGRTVTSHTAQPPQKRAACASGGPGRHAAAIFAAVVAAATTALSALTEA